ncbi:NAD(P)-binding protein [Nocardiopsis sp. SBT366]|uniref:NAD(P)-binding protein n=1 Tax=Nocardiopsis sp. SBT366 TaxID=1580529 RepID=UPI00350FB76D
MIGAGISGIGAAHRLRVDFPNLGFVVIEAQGERGGTWWTHRYAGVRSDSDLFTYGYRQTLPGVGHRGLRRDPRPSTR